MTLELMELFHALSRRMPQSVLAEIATGYRLAATGLDADPVDIHTVVIAVADPDAAVGLMMNLVAVDEVPCGVDHERHAAGTVIGDVVVIDPVLARALLKVNPSRVLLMLSVPLTPTEFHATVLSWVLGL